MNLLLLLETPINRERDQISLIYDQGGLASPGLGSFLLPLWGGVARQPADDGLGIRGARPRQTGAIPPCIRQYGLSDAGLFRSFPDCTSPALPRKKP